MKKKDIALILFIFISVFSIIIIKPIDNLDELWNYNTARAISEGLIPYKDISMITTPILPAITAIFLKLISNELIISRILAAVEWTAILVLVYKILKKLIEEDEISIILTLLIGIICRYIFCIDYNVTVLLITLIILNEELKEKNNDYIIGILAGLAICTKQSIGITLAIIVLGIKLLFVENREQLKEYFKIVVKRIIGMIIPIILVFFYLIFTGAINDFIDYAILGIRSFSNKIPYIMLFENNNIEIEILSRLMPISFIIIPVTLFIVIKLKKRKIENTLMKLLMYSLSIIIVMYPISDEIHFLIGSLISIISLMYVLCLLGKKIYDKIKYKKKNKVYRIVMLIIETVIIVIILNTVINNIYSYLKKDKNTEIRHYINIEIGENLKNRIKNIDDYIMKNEQSGRKVYILDAEAVLYMIPIDKYNKNYDMFLKGNIGKDSEQGQIKKIKQRDKNTIYLIRNEKLKNNWQTPSDVISYIRDNLEKIDEIEIFDVYR